ncbi:diguanylate cyclase [Shewanella aestuarii]|uniref:diguanylate cyclase n=2 Tax=Shewanella aestuarii TaxID=1028752 RepID=A0A6G9QP66_9GAMM|nr:diguanylate cyclase [Shewanella aestuarii]
MFSLLLGVVALIINCYPIPFFANVQFILGNTLTVISSILFGPWYALLTSILASTGLVIVWDSFHVYIIFGLEALFLGFCRRRDIYALYGSVIFWLVFGMPAFYLLGNLFFDLPNNHLPFVTLKQAINSMIYTSIASLLVLSIPKLWRFKGRIKDKQRRSLSKQVTYFITLMITLSLLLSALLFNFYFLERQQQLVKVNQNETVRHIAYAGETYLENHIKVIENAAYLFTITNDSPTSSQAFLSNLHRNYPSFISMLMTNEKGNFIALSPLSKFQNPDEFKLNNNVKDRDYFIESFYNLRVYVSSVFVGRGFGNDAIVAMSAPYFDKTDHTKALGIIEGSLDLNYFDKIDYDFEGMRNQSIVLTDEKNNIIYASNQLNLKVMTPFHYALYKGRYQTTLDLININNTDSSTPEYIYAKSELSNGWKLYIVEPFTPLLKIAENQMLNSFAMLLVALLLTFYISNKISQLLSIPLEMIANQFSQLAQSSTKHQLLDDNAPREVYSLYETLLASKQQLIDHQLELENIVAIRTEELETANTKLKELVDRDPLTALYNRRYAEHKFIETREFCLRSEQAITVAVVDLDFFKAINDTYGHLAGDECLRQVASVLKQHFKRDIDIISRYGGEEFMLILPMSNALNIEHHLNEFRLKLNQILISIPNGSQQLTLTCSIGAIIANANYHHDLDRWIKIADDNLYQAKAQGRNRTILTIISPETES